MQIVIDIDEEDYERLKEYKKAPFCSLTSRAYEAIANGTHLPDNATNGDVIKTLFPEWVANHLKFHMGKNWWNTPYKEKEE